MRPIAPALPHGILTHADHLAMAELNRHCDEIERARLRLLSQLRRGVPLDPAIAYVPEVE